MEVESMKFCVRCRKREATREKLCEDCVKRLVKKFKILESDPLDSLEIKTLVRYYEDAY